MKKLILFMLLTGMFTTSEGYACTGTITDELLCETPEILFETGEAQVIKAKAESLGSVVTIYEYMRNRSQYTLYHGARSSSLNTFLGLQGNDVDLASTLIAMYRAVGVKSRYAVGNIRIQRSKLANWIGVANTDLALSILQNQGINIVDDTDPKTVTFEHVWVEALVNFSNYRGAGVIKTCVSESDECQWISLDPSFKQYRYNPTYRDLLANVNFDYNAYYNAENNQDLRDKNPLEIFEESSLKFLRTNNPGVTLEDVIDKGVIIEENLGLLPASLPFEVVGSVRKFDSLKDHDASPDTEHVWNKKIKVSIYPIIAGVVCDESTDYFVGDTFSAVDLSTKQLTANWTVQNIGSSQGASSRFSLRLDGEVRGRELVADGAFISCGGGFQFINQAVRFNLEMEVDASPFQEPVKVTYNDLMVGGYYLIATGGETSNWSQVRRAYENLLSANEQYLTITHTDGKVYVDENQNGIVDADDSLLLENQEAQDALTGGLLYIAQAVYYTRLKQASQRYSRLKNIVSPISAFAGVVSTTFDVELVGDTPFSVLPGGLLIDLKGIRLNGTWEADQPETYSNEAFKFLGHVASSLEHEVWQELTGYDAVSTMRGIQFALRDGADLMDIHNTSTENTFEASLGQMGIDHTLPDGFTQKDYSIFGRELVAWEYSGTEPSTAGFHVFRGDLTNYANTDTQAIRLDYTANNGVNEFLSSFDPVENQLNDLIQQGQGDLLVTLSCNGNTYENITVTQALSQWEDCFNEIVNDPQNVQLFDFLDKNKGFEPNIVFYKDRQILVDEYGIDFVSDVRDRMYYAPEDTRFNYIAPSKIAVGPTFAFSVYIRDFIDTTNENIASSAYIIENKSSRLSAGGGYVPEGVPVNPATDTEGVLGSADTLDTSGVTFNNEVFTNQNLVSIANNDVVRTPSTVDPVSTVTGNMYHDETDFVINGKGLSYTFTRTYNSNETTTDGPDSINPSYLPFSQGWTHSYNMKLVSNDYGKYPNYSADLAPENDNNKTSSITYVNERGGENNYLLDDETANAQPTPPRASFDTLLLDTPSVGLHSLTFTNGITYIFDSQGSDMRLPGVVARLHKIEDPYGNALNFGYVNNRLTGITDNLGLSDREGLVLEYYTSGENINRLRYVTDWTGRRWEYQYNNGQLSSMINPLNQAMNYTYIDDTHLLKDIIHPQSRGSKKKTMTFDYYSNNQAYSYVDQLGQQESLTYDLFRRRTRITNPRGFITEHYYDQHGAMTKLIEPDNGVLLFENNEDGLRFNKFDALGNRTRYSYHSNRNLTGIASDTQGLVTREQDALNFTTDYDYGVFNQVTILKDKNGTEFTNIYYAVNDTSIGAVKGRLEKSMVSSVTVNGVAHNNVTMSEYQYFPDGTLKKGINYIDPAQPLRKQETNFTYKYADDGSYILTQTTTGSGINITLEEQYDALWRLVSRTSYRQTSPADATLLALTTQYEYDALGRMVKMTDPIGNIAENVLDDNGQILQSIMRYQLLSSGNTALKDGCIVDPAYPNHHTCVMSTNEYDLADRLIKTTDIVGAVTRFEYDQMGNVLKTINDQGNILFYEYDNKGRRTKVTNENGYSVLTEYDLAGRVKSVTDANNHRVSFFYDALGRRTSTISPEGRETRFDEYDGNGNIVKQTDASAVAGEQPKNSQGVSIYNEFDEFNRLLSTLNANNEDTIYTYDLLGNRTSVTDAKNQTTMFVYDDLSRLVKVIDPIIEANTDKQVDITHDEHGNRLRYVDRLGEVTQNTYDRLDRLVMENYLQDNLVAEHVYDQYGDMVSTSYGGSVYTYTYDANHRMLSKTDSRENKTMSWQYDKLGNVISKVNYEGERQQFVYDSTNRLVSMSVGDPAYIQASYQYDPAGRLLSRVLSNGAATLYGYTPDGFIAKMKQLGAGGQVLEERQYQYDQVGNITQISLIKDGTTETILYNYDPAYRLLSADSSNDSHDYSYTYDMVGNRLSKMQGGVTHHYFYNNLGNRLDEVRIGTPTGIVLNRYIYDDNGSLIEKRNTAGEPVLQIEYDQRRLVSNMQADTENTTFTYDANLYRISKQGASSSKNYFLEAEHLESVYDNNHELQASYLRGIVVDEIINGFERNGTDKLKNITFHHDQVNSVVALTDHNGSSVQIAEYGPFGESLNIAGSSQNAMQYTGRENDSESGLYYYRARYYDPQIGRFISEDPIGFGGGVNFYAYVENNPLTYVDPLGHDGINVGVAFKLPYKLGGLSINASLRFPGVSDERFDLQLSAHGTPSKIFESASQLNDIVSEPRQENDLFINEKVQQSSGFDYSAKLVGTVGYSYGNSEQRRIIQPETNVKFYAGGVDFLLGGEATMTDVANNSAPVPTDYSLAVGPQFGASVTLEHGASVSFRSVVEKTFGGVRNMFNSFTGSNGAFVIYPSKINTNQTYLTPYSK